MLDWIWSDLMTKDSENIMKSAAKRDLLVLGSNLGILDM